MFEVGNIIQGPVNLTFYDYIFSVKGTSIFYTYHMYDGNWGRAYNNKRDFYPNWYLYTDFFREE